MKKLEFTVEINASKEDVWKALWNNENYVRWTEIFASGSHYIGEFKEGNFVQFLDGKKNGMFAKIVKLSPNETIHFTHLGDVVNGISQEEIYGKDAIENYDLAEKDGKTNLAFTMNVPEEYFQFFVNKFPSVLDKIKEIAESTT